ncbi:MAG: hypothetical protein K2Q26_02685 [Bdellovibrionales bacterium]|nr:hypothetical protein [Bdellovibrionales bacterium]
MSSRRGSSRGARQLFNSTEDRQGSTTSLFVKNHKNPDHLLSQIEALYLQNQTAEVLHLIDCVIENNSDLLNTPELFVLHAKALIEFHGFGYTAESQLSQALILDPQASSATELQNLFALHDELRDGLYASCEEKLGELLKKDPKNAFALFLLGNHLLWKTGSTQEAIQHLEKAVELRPSFLKAWVSLAMAYKKNHLFVMAEQAFQECISLDPNPNQQSFYKTHLQAL